MFLTHEQNYTQIVVNRECLEKQSFSKAMGIRGCQIVRQVGELIRDAVKETIKNAISLP